MSRHYLVKHEWPKSQRNSLFQKTNESQHSAVKYLVLLRQGLLPEMRELSDFFTFQQDSAPAHRARSTVELLEKEVPGVVLTSRRLVSSSVSLLVSNFLSYTILLLGPTFDTVVLSSTCWCHSPSIFRADSLLYLPLNQFFGQHLYLNSDPQKWRHLSTQTAHTVLNHSSPTSSSSLYTQIQGGP